MSEKFEEFKTENLIVGVNLSDDKGRISIEIYNKKTKKARYFSINDNRLGTYLSFNYEAL